MLSKKSNFSDIVYNFLSKLVDCVMITIYLSLIIIGGYALFDIHKVESSAKISESTKADVMVDNEISIGALKEINNEIFAWISLDGTEIDFPVLKPNNNSKYLTRDYKGEYSQSGAIFEDYRSSIINDNYSVIYGHRMNGDKMFGSIAKFSDRDYFNSHKSGLLVTENTSFNIEVLAYSELNIQSTKAYSLPIRGQVKNVVTSILDGAKNKNGGANFEENAKYLLLSTCNKDSKYTRDVLLTKIVSHR